MWWGKARLRVACAGFFLLSVTLLMYSQQIHSPVYVYEFPNKQISYPTLFLGNKKRACIPNATLTVQSGGRLGNLIMEYASTWSMARIYNVPAFVPEEIIYRLQNVFQPLSVKGKRDFLRESTTCRGSGEVVGAMRRIDQRLASLDGVVEIARRRGKLIVLELCVVLVETLLPLVHKLHEEFEYRPQLALEAHRILWSLRHSLVGNSTAEEVQYVGVHVRRTDYRDQIKLLYNTTREADVDYYLRAVTLMRQQLSPATIVFVVTSDDPAWSRETLIPALRGQNDALGRYGVYWGGSGNGLAPEQDLALISFCNHSVIAYGTFGLWSALWAGGRAIVFDVTGGNGFSPSMQFARNMQDWTIL